MSITIKTPYEIAKDLARRARERRLDLNLSQKTLSDRSGVSYGTLKKFEKSGQISLESLLKLALVLNALNDFDNIVFKKHEKLPSSLDELLEDHTKKRGRK